jgi:hypothetical protein
MALSTDIRFSPRNGGDASSTSALGQGRMGQGATGRTPNVERSRLAVTTTDSPFRLVAGGIAEFKDRRRRRRVEVAPMYTTARVRV